jgi:hypothetical protein
MKADVTIAAQPLLNSALNEDTLDNGWVRNPSRQPSWSY